MIIIKQYIYSDQVLQTYSWSVRFGKGEVNIEIVFKKSNIISWTHNYTISRNYSKRWINNFIENLLITVDFCVYWRI